MHHLLIADIYVTGYCCYSLSWLHELNIYKYWLNLWLESSRSIHNTREYTIGHVQIMFFSFFVDFQFKSDLLITILLNKPKLVFMSFKHFNFLFLFT